MEGVLRRFFESKTQELLGRSRQVLANHKGLRGSHREQACREFLAEFLPRRYSVGRGIVFDGIGHASRECDVVVWDDDNYPRLQEKGHTLFFVNSVRCVVEVKSRWSQKHWSDTLQNSRSVRDLIANTQEMDGLGIRLQRLEHQVAAMRQGASHEGMLIYPHHVATGAILLTGGAGLDAKRLSACTPDPDDCLPDVVLCLEPGILIEKGVIEVGKHLRGRVELRRLGDRALFGFIMRLLALIRDRSAAIENTPHFPDAFDLSLDAPTNEFFDFPLSRPPAGVQAFYRNGSVEHEAGDEHGRS